MVRLLLTCFYAFLLYSSAIAQTPQPRLTPAQLTYFHFLLLTLSSDEIPPEIKEAYKRALPYHFGMNEQEIATVLAASSELRLVLQQLRSSLNRNASDTGHISATQAAALAEAAVERDKAIERLANQIINGVRPETAARLRAPGDLVTRALAGKGNSNVAK